MENSTPRVEAAKFLQKQLGLIDLDKLSELSESPRIQSLLRYHVETYITKFGKTLSRASEHKLIKPELHQ